MTTVLVTGAAGFVGKNLIVALSRRPELVIRPFDRSNAPGDLDRFVAEADVVYHLAGVNRPERVEEFEEGNAGFTRTLVELLRRHGKRVPFVLSSSTQAALDNPYGRSKRMAEEIVTEWAKAQRVPAVVYRLPGVFGKWCRPNYNSVVATFCHSAARGLDLAISDPAHEIDLVYIDDVVGELLKALEPDFTPPSEPRVQPTFRVTLGELARHIHELRDIRRTLVLPDFADGFTRRLHATYLSYLPSAEFAYTPEARTDARGTLVELLKSPHFGQVFVSRSHRGVVRGNHYHDTKIEKFCVIEGTAAIRFRHILGEEVITYRVSGDTLQIVDIPPGYTHSIENVGDGELVVLFWAGEIFDSARPDTYAKKV